ncbi:metal-dependent hydrolase [Arthrobacter zhaoguopingii]|uniref:metal-dependent hydrolase n=1 Tax=Arthrobacter zhaoguopingii TaxID=2681491 RepID=UPI0013593832|nr:metal-dependent hydrolase [Arthrobacter zhaoguopingii]
MSLPSSDTAVSYPAGALTSESTILHVEERADGSVAVLLDATACHPVDAAWPDQGPDRAVLEVGGSSLPITDCVVGATDGRELFLGAGIPVRKGTEGWAFVVAHLIQGPPPAEGERAVVRVDGTHRAALSAGHTGCHLASLALNRALADRWKKEVPTDALGTSNFDAVAIETSTITEYGSLDVYRLGRSLRRKGFITEGFDPAPVEAALNETLSGWLASGGAIRIARDGERLTDRRYWECDLPEGSVHIPCGGTHAESLAGFSSLQASLALEEVDGTPVLTMTTSVLPRL